MFGPLLNPEMFGHVWNPTREPRERSRSAERWRASARQGRQIAAGTYNTVSRPPDASDDSRTVIRVHHGDLSDRGVFLGTARNALAEKELGDAGIIPKTDLINARYDETKKYGEVIQQIERFATDMSELDESGLTNSQVEKIASSTLQNLARFAELRYVYFDIKPQNMGVFLGGMRGHQGVMHDIDKAYFSRLPKGIRTEIAALCKRPKAAEKAVVCAASLGLLMLTLEEFNPDARRLMSHFQEYAWSVNFPMARILLASFASEPSSEFWSEFVRIYADRFLGASELDASRLMPVFRAVSSRLIPSHARLMPVSSRLMPVSSAGRQAAGPSSERQAARAAAVAKFANYFQCPEGRICPWQIQGRLSPECCQTRCPPKIDKITFSYPSGLSGALKGSLSEARALWSHKVPDEEVLRKLKLERRRTPLRGLVSDANTPSPMPFTNALASLKGLVWQDKVARHQTREG